MHPCYYLLFNNIVAVALIYSEPPPPFLRLGPPPSLVPRDHPGDRRLARSFGAAVTLSVLSFPAYIV